MLKSLIIPLIFSGSLLAAQPVIQWQSVQGNSFDDVFNDVLISNEGDIYAVGVFHSNPPAMGAKGVQDVWLIKYSVSGTLIWEKKYGGSKADRGYSVAQLTGGNLAIVATSESSDGDVSTNNGNRDVWVICVDTAGSIQWEVSIGGSGFEEGKRVITTSTGLAVVYEKGAPDYDLAISFLNNNGIVQNTYMFGSSCIDKCIDGVQLSDGNFVLAGIVECADGDISNVYGNNDVWLVKLDPSGQVLWEKTYGGSGNDAPGALVEGDDGNIYVIAQSLFSDNDVPPLKGGQDIWILAVDTAIGDLKWSKTYGSVSNDFGDDILSFNNQLYAIGTAGGNGGDLGGTNNGKQDLWVLKLALDGNLLWKANFGSSQNDKGYGIAAKGNRLLAVGFSGGEDGDVPVNFGSGDAWLLSLGEPVGLKEIDPFLVDIYPQPFMDKLNFKVGKAPVTIQFFSVNGTMVASQKLYQFEGNLDLSGLANGIYALKVISDSGIVIKKIFKANH